MGGGAFLALLGASEIVERWKRKNVRRHKVLVHKFVAKKRAALYCGERGGVLQLGVTSGLAEGKVKRACTAAKRRLRKRYGKEARKEKGAMCRESGRTGEGIFPLQKSRNAEGDRAGGKKDYY